MSTPHCALCQAPVRAPFRAPTAELAPDLDMRPGEPARSTLPRWVPTCRTCGASAPDLAALPAQAKAVVESAEYRALRGPAPELPFLRWAMICENAGDPAAAAEATLQAAWALDDAGRDAAALRCRAVALWGTPADTADALRLIDMLRRAGAFEAAGHAASTLEAQSPDENSANILRFQQARIAAQDSGRHMLSSALRPPARTPHVTHGRAPAHPGFWRRLLGR